jgi:hypothetical protein
MTGQTTAQQDIPSDWIAARRKYFSMHGPLLIRAGFAFDPYLEQHRMAV